MVISDLYLDGVHTGFDLLERSRAASLETPFILMTGQADLDSALRALRMGAFDFLPKPMPMDRLLGTVEKAISLKLRRSVPGRMRGDAGARLIGTSTAMVEVYSAIARASLTESPVLIVGERGTGKNLIAFEIHRNSARASGPFVAFRCAGMSDEEFDRELLPEGKQVGIVKTAEGGTLMLEEVHELSRSSQRKLARIIEKRSDELGRGSQSGGHDVRFIGSIVQQGGSQPRLEPELHYALSVIQIAVSPLRNRLGDLPALIAHLLDRIGDRIGKRLAVTEAAIARLRKYGWPGNVRELAYVLEAAVAKARTHLLDESDFEDLLSSDKPSAAGVPAPTDAERILAVVAECGGNVERAARILGLGQFRVKEKLNELVPNLKPRPESAVQCVACGTCYDAEEVQELDHRCPRCEHIEGAMLIPAGAGEIPEGNAPRFKGNRYVLYRLLARTKFSEVWAGWQPNLCRRVVIKFLASEFDRAADRFLREARVQAMLNHPNIPTVYESGTDELIPGKMFIAMEFVQGIPLDQWSRELKGKANGAEQVRRTLWVFAQVADALQHMHEHSVVHRDVKPQNILVTQADHAFLIDYGIARPFDATDVMTGGGFIIGTVPFMAPEQIVGDADAIDPRTDVWGLAATMYFILTGVFPFVSGDYEELVEKIQSEAPAPPTRLNPDVSPDVEGIILRGLSKSKSNRFARMVDMGDAIRVALHGLYRRAP